MSVGVASINVWTVTNSAPFISNKKGKMPPSKPGKNLGFPSLAYTKSSMALLAASDGNVYGYNGGSLAKTYKGIHAKMVSCIKVVENAGGQNEIVVTGGSDKKIHVHTLDASKNLQTILSYEVTATPRSVDYMND